jgi:hypothetical protein
MTGINFNSENLKVDYLSLNLKAVCVFLRFYKLKLITK